MSTYRSDAEFLERLALSDDVRGVDGERLVDIARKLRRLDIPESPYTVDNPRRYFRAYAGADHPLAELPTPIGRPVVYRVDELEDGQHPEAELTNSVSYLRVSIASYGDCPGSTSAEVYAYDAEVAATVALRAATELNDGLRDLFRPIDLEGTDPRDADGWERRPPFRMSPTQTVSIGLAPRSPRSPRSHPR